MMNDLSLEFLMQQAWIFLRYGRTEDAIVVLEGLSVLTPRDDWVDRSLSYAYLQNRDYQKSLDQISRFSGSRSTHLERVIRVRAHWGLGQRVEARRLLKQMDGKLRDLV